MNRIYQLVWSEARGQYVAASEKTPSQGRKGRGTAVVALGGLLAGLMGALDASALEANTLPTGGTVTAGAATLATSGATLNVNQSTQRAAINWQSFSVGSNATVNFNQPNASAVTLNRVVGNEGSVIAGALNANGQVFVLNSNGVLFAQGAQVNVGGLVASTLNLSDADFMAGRSTFTSNGSRASVINMGTITTADGGYAALLGNQVKNQGVIVARLGTAALAAGDRVSLNFNGNSLVGVTIEQGTLNALVENGHAIRADGGLVVLTAKGVDAVLGSLVNNTGEVRAQTVANKDGKIYLLSDMEHGTTTVGGTLDASAPNGGNGGFIETSAAKVSFAPGVQITTKAATGIDGHWLIDPVDFTIGAGGNITGADLGNLLASNDITIQTTTGTNSVTNLYGTTGTAGNINVNQAVSWSARKLTLEAAGDINVNAVMTASGTGQLDMKTGYNFNSSSPAYDATKGVKVGFNPDGTFRGRVDFMQANGVTPRAGSGFLSINGNSYTVIADIGAASHASSLPTTMTLQGLAAIAPTGPQATDVYSQPWDLMRGYFALGANIDASPTSAWNSNAGFTPIGDVWNLKSFAGALNGLGHTVNNLTIQRTGTWDSVGMFSALGSGNAVDPGGQSKI